MIRRTALALLCTLSVGNVSAQEESLCTAPGLSVLSDAAGDVDFQFLPAGLPVDGYDVQALSVAELAGADGPQLLFTLKVASLAQPTPRQAWFATFLSGDKRAYAVRMAVDEEGAVAFQSYTVLIDADGNVTEGRYPETGSVKPAQPESSFDADGTIRIVVNAQDLGLRKGVGKISGFNAGSLQQIPTGDTLTPSGDLLALIADGMPDDMARSGPEIEVGSTCAASKSAAPAQFGGAFGAAALLLLALGAGLRRRL